VEDEPLFPEEGYADEYVEDEIPVSPDMRVEKIPLGQLVPNEWNPNAMDPETFNRLTNELSNVGFIDPIQVVPTDDGRYRILGGEHRYQAAKVLGWDELPCVILTEERWQDEDLQKFVTVRLNMLHGKLNPTKMVQLYEEMADKYGEDSLQELFAFTDSDAWEGLLKEMTKGIKQSGLPKDMADKFDEAAKEIKTVEGLSHVLNKLFTDYGDTLKHNFMVFTFGGKEHLFIAMSKKMKKTMDRVKKFCVENDLDINAVMQPVTGKWLEHVEAEGLDPKSLPEPTEG
jgi:hypothetical protein